MKNIFVSFTDGENVLIHALDSLTEEEIATFAERARLCSIEDVYEIKDEEIQYYNIYNRCWIDTEEKAKALRTIIH